MATVRREDADPNASLEVREAAAKQDNVFDFLQNRILMHYPQAAQILRREMPAPRMAIVYLTCECSNLNSRFVKYNEIMNEVMRDNDAQFEFI